MNIDCLKLEMSLGEFVLQRNDILLPCLAFFEQLHPAHCKSRRVQKPRRSSAIHCLHPSDNRGSQPLFTSIYSDDLPQHNPNSLIPLGYVWRIYTSLEIFLKNWSPEMIMHIYIYMYSTTPWRNMSPSSTVKLTFSLYTRSGCSKNGAPKTKWFINGLP